MEELIENNSHYKETKWKIQNMVAMVVGENSHDDSERGKLVIILGML